MKKFEPLTNPQELDFYTIYEQDGVKYIHLFGYTYESSSNEYVTEENPNGIYWANMGACGVEVPLAEFVEECEGEENVANDVVNDLYETASQYQGDFTSETVLTEVINTYFDGRPADAYLQFPEITMDTPCGNYVNVY